MSRPRQQRVARRSRRSSRPSQIRSNTARDLVGRDVARLPLGNARRLWLMLLAIGLPFALGLAALRVDLIRVRYALAEAEKSARALELRHRELLAEARTLRRPERIEYEAERLGFATPRHLISIEALREAAPVPAGELQLASAAPSNAHESGR